MSVVRTRWASLARDLAVLTLPYSPLDLPDIRNTYDITDAELAELLRNPDFLKLFEKEMDLCEKAGDKAVVRYRTGTLSQALAEKLFRDAMGDSMKPGEALKLLDLLLKTSGFMAEDKTPTVAVQTNISLPLPHVDKLAHCFANQSQEALDV